MASVLFADDEPHFLEPVADALRQLGFVVHFAETIKDALAKLETLHVDVLVIDVYIAIRNYSDLSSSVADLHRDVREWLNESAREPGLALYSRVRKERPDIKPILYSRVPGLYLRNARLDLAIDCPIIRKPPAGAIEEIVGAVTAAV